MFYYLSGILCEGQSLFHFICFRFPCMPCEDPLYPSQPAFPERLRVPSFLPPTIMCVFSASGVVFGCGHFVVKELREVMGSCGNPYCRWSANHPTNDHNCREDCRSTYVIGRCEPMSESAGFCPTCRYVLSNMTRPRQL